MPIYNNFKFRQLGGQISLSADTIKAALMTSSFSGNIDSHSVWSDVSSNEVAATGGYVAGGTALASKTLTQDNSNDLAYFDAADTTWAASTITARFLVLYKDTGVAGTSALIGYYDFGSDKSSSSGNFTLQWAATGILSIA
jgi:hypothetical protein